MKFIVEVDKMVRFLPVLAKAEARALRSALLLACLTLVSANLFSCAKAKYERQEYSATALAGQYTKPKIDIIVFQDYSASMFGPMATIKSQFNNFVNQLDSRWDYHFTVLPLQNSLSVNYKYILAQDCSSVNSPYCLNNGQKDFFNSAANDAGWINSINTAIGSEDLSFSNMTNNLTHSSMTTTNFLRPDAALAMIIISNGEDLSAVDGFNNYIQASTLPGFYIDPDGDGTSQIDYTIPAYVSAKTKFQNFLSSFHTSAPVKRIFSIVAQNTNYGSSCHGYPAWAGNRYMDVTSWLNGHYYDFCNASTLSNVLNTIAYDMTSMMDAFIFDYVVLDSAPVVDDSLQIFKNGVQVPQGGANGWTYVGQMTNAPTSFYPTPSNFRSGFFIKMNGTSTYKGSDQITIKFKKL